MNCSQKCLHFGIAEKTVQAAGNTAGLSCAQRNHENFAVLLQVTHILKDVFAEGTHLSLCLNASPASKDFRGETLQLLEQLSLPQKPRSVAPFRYEPCFWYSGLRCTMIRGSCMAISHCRHLLMQREVLVLPGHQQHPA